ncbi:electron carrier [Coemansia sp. RSA 1365]|nr:electron carrier [Coemansia sp. RSA 1365]
MSLTHTAEAGQTILLVARTSTEAEWVASLQKLRDTLIKQVGTEGKVDFEQVDRIENREVSLPSAHYDSIVANPTEPWTVEHSSGVLASILLALKPSGALVLKELVIESACSLEVSPVTRTLEDFTQQLKFAGFVNTQSETCQLVPEATLRILAKKCWKLDDVEGFVAQARGNIFIAAVKAKKPSYNVGAAAALPFGRRAVSQNAEALANRGAPKAWMISVESDDEGEFEDQDGLLAAEDLARPDVASLVRPDGTKARRKPCKNCTCGLADGGEVNEDVECGPADKPKKPKKPVDVVNVKSSCGSCSLGDAFRCSSCPYLGMPAFKPGEKVALGGSMLHDDFMP